MKAAEIVLVRFPFADIQASKKRPALVLAETARGPRAGLLTVAMITSQVEGNALPGDVDLADWEAAGLLHPNRLRMAKVASMDRELSESRLGTLSARDQRSARRAFRQIFSAWA
ncbi:MAG: type II toxin-antitoxin system PemK/MazF family toxin [Deltaproteobacteria bacterium]